MGFRASELIEMICAAVQGNDSNERSTGKVCEREAERKKQRELRKQREGTS
jgi:hypothetical protein